MKNLLFRVFTLTAALSLCACAATKNSPKVSATKPTIAPTTKPKILSHDNFGLLFAEILVSSVTVCGKAPYGFTYKEIPASFTKSAGVLMYQTRQYLFLVQCDPVEEKKKLTAKEMARR